MVQDICQLSQEGRKYDIIVDSYCLQGIVTDTDREKLFSVVRARLKPAGYYLISTAMFDENRFCEDKLILDSKSNTVYNKYGEDLIDPRSNIVYTRLVENPEHYEGVIKIRDQFYILNRRHLKPRALRAELEGEKFDVLYQDRGNVICAQKDSLTTLITE